MAPPSNWLANPSDEKGREKKCVSETEFAKPTFPNGVKRPIVPSR